MRRLTAAQTLSQAQLDWPTRREQEIRSGRSETELEASRLDDLALQHHHLKYELARNARIAAHVRESRGAYVGEIAQVPSPISPPSLFASQPATMVSILSAATQRC